jgi:lipoate-protein ligase A
MRGPFRLLDLGAVGGLRSQSVYHALCASVGQGAPNTVVVLRPRDAYACLGYHSDLRLEVDLEYCRGRGLPVYRRQTGGGTVYVDGDQLFFQLVVAERDAPRGVARAYAEGLRPLVETYRALGLDARLTDVNDVTVGGRKISGTAMASVDGAVVVTGNVILDFDVRTMARLLRLPDEATRREVEEAMRTHLTSLRREMGEGVSRRRVKAVLLRQVARAFGGELARGSLTAAERARVRQVERRLLSAEWLDRFRAEPSDVRRVKVKGGVHVCHVRSGGAACVVTAAGGRIASLRLLEGCAAPGGGRQAVEQALAGCELQPEALREAVARACRAPGAGAGVPADVLAGLLLQAAAGVAAAA